MDPTHKDLLRKQRLALANELLVSDHIVPYLYQEHILADFQVEEIESQSTDRQKVFRLLDLLPKRGPMAFSCFLRSLDDFSWVRDRLLQELETESEQQPEPVSADDPNLPESLLQKVPSDQELSRVASRLGSSWESVLLELGLSSEDQFRCQSDHVNNSHGAVLEGLIQWRQRGGKKATFKKLLECLQAADIHPSVLQDALTCRRQLAFN